MTTDGPLALYQRQLAQGRLRPDPDQERAVQALQDLFQRLRAEPPTPPPSSGGLFGLFRRRQDTPAAPAIRGLYLWGSVGRGKSMLMDLFVESRPVPQTRRVHFHAFMLEIQARLHGMRQSDDRRAGGGTDPVGALAAQVAAETRLLCFDEFHVVNIADAMILGRLFAGLFDAGVTVVATSNWPPDRLYWNGLNRERVLPFIELLKSRVDIIALDGPTDYRVARLRDLKTWFAPLGPEADAAVDRLFLALTDGRPGEPTELQVGSRTLPVPRADGPVAAFDFADLCARPLGAADYLAIGDRFRVVFLLGVPLLSTERRNEARRFMTLIDALYERRLVVIVTAEGQPDQLYPVGEGAFEFQRTVSRLMEMQSSAWLEASRAAQSDEPVSFAPFALTSDLT